MPKFSEDIKDDTIVTGTNQYGIEEHGFWSNNRWWPVCRWCHYHKWEAQVEGDTLCLVCQEVHDV